MMRRCFATHSEKYATWRLLNLFKQWKSGFLYMNCFRVHLKDREGPAIVIQNCGPMSLAVAIWWYTLFSQFSWTSLFSTGPTIMPGSLAAIIESKCRDGAIIGWCISVLLGVPTDLHLGMQLWFLWILWNIHKEPKPVVHALYCQCTLRDTPTILH